jgi:hypothetical protein
MSDSEYLDKFRKQLDVLRSAGGDICQHPGMVQDELDKASGYGAENPNSNPPSTAEKRAAAGLPDSDLRLHYS